MPRLSSALLLAAACTTGCFSAPPIKNNGPITTSEGVSVSILSGHCEVDVAERRRSAGHQIALMLRVDNRSPESLVVRPAYIRLRVRSEEVVATDPELFSRIDPWKSRHLVLGFLSPADCSAEFRLDFDEALQLGPRRVAMQALEFTPVEPR